MNNTRFATAIHILSVLAISDDQWSSSEYIAGSINVNPVIVRKEVAILKEFQFIMSRKGKEGGARLKRPSDEIFLSEIFVAVKSSEVLGKKNKNPNPNCPIGKEINNKLSQLYNDVDVMVFDFLKTKTLKNFIDQF